MNKTEALKALKSMGTAQNRKVYGRHGVTGAMFGVSYANLGKLKRQIKTDHKLALGLWASGNHDARILATMIADPVAMTGKELDTWVAAVDNHVTSAAVAGVAASSPAGAARAKKWCKARGEWVSAAGWSTVSALVHAGDALSDDDQRGMLEMIEKNIHKSKNRTRYSMNAALINIGAFNAKLRKAAVQVAKKIGVVEVDHGETGCQTPDAASYIAKTVAHHNKKARKKVAKKGAKKV